MYRFHYRFNPVISVTLTSGNCFRNEHIPCKSVSSYLGGHLAVVDPAQGGKVCGLCAVEAMVEASMVAIRKGDHKLSFILCYLFMQSQNTETD